MREQVEILKRMYTQFNAQNMDGVLGELAEDVTWANAMEGGHEQGRDAVRAYWTRQWAQVRPRVTPVAFRQGEDGSVVVEVEQLVFDLKGKALQGQEHELEDKTVLHVFLFRDGKVVSFDVLDTGTPSR